MKKILFCIVAGWIGLFFLLYLTRLDVTIPPVKLRFISPNPGQVEQIQYSYVYDGEDIMRNTKFGGLGGSPILSAHTGDVIVIPSKRIISFWPFSHFSHLLINGEIANKGANCSYNVSIWSDDAVKRLNLYTGLAENRNEYLFQNIKDHVLEIKCS